MTTYADPTRCPDCHAVLPPSPTTCPVCALPLSGRNAFSLFATLQEADRLLGVLRTQKRPVPAHVGAPVSDGSLVDGLPAYPTATPAPPTVPVRARMSGASVPKILLSLGALCLLVAAVIFLAVAWSWLGVGGRTAVLVALTGTSLGLAVTMHRRSLRTAAESFSVIGLGLLAVDVVGIRHAGWLGPLDDDGLLLVTGTALATGALALLAVTVRRPLVSPAVVAPLGILVAWAGAQSSTGGALPGVVAAVVLLGLARVGTQVPSRTLQVTSVAASALAWVSVVGNGLDGIGDPVTAGHYWGHLAVWPLLVATALVAAAGPAVGLRRSVSVGGLSVAALLGSYVTLGPVLDNDPTVMAWCVLGVAAGWTAVLLLARGELGRTTLLPLGGTLVVPTVAAVTLVGEAARAVASVGAPYSDPFGVRVAARAVELSPLLVLPASLVVATAALSALRLAEPVRRTTWCVVLGAAAALGIVGTLPLYDVPLVVVIGLVLVCGAACYVAADRSDAARANAWLMASLVLVAGSALLALPSDRLSAAVLAVASLGAARSMTRPGPAGAVAAGCFPVAFAAFVWSVANVAGVEEQYRAVPILLVLGGLALWKPRVELEASAATVVALASVAAVTAAYDVLLALAIHLTLAGVLVTATSIVHQSRRLLAWPGGLLLAAATWVRLVDLGVHVPEAYTLPSALVLAGVGVWRLRQDDSSATLTCLTPGLLLGTVPSLLAMIDEPASLRALLLGVACLALTVGGAVARWSAPLVVGASVGALLVLRDLAPYAHHVPTWTAIGVSGVALLVVGVTWESRMHDVRRAARYLDSLR